MLGPPPSHRQLPVTAGASLLFTRQGCGYCIPSLSGTVGICVWPGWGEGTLNKQPMAPVNAKAQPRLTVLPPYAEAIPWPAGQGASRIHLARKGWCSASHSPAGPDSAWVPLMLSLPLGPFTP